MQKLTPICAMFLTQFDVHTGYELKWFKSLNDDLYSSKDIEFKSIPSGLHSVNSDTICFVQPKNDTDSFLYGISIFKQNSHLQQVNDDGIVDRSKVKLFSLGVLIDPLHLEKNTEFNDWKLKVYSAGWNYRSDLSQLLSNFMNLTTDKQEEEFFAKFNKFFIDSCYNIKSSESPILDSLNTTTPTTTTTTTTTITTPNVKLSPILRSKSPSIATSILDVNLTSDHMIDSLLPFINNFGPLIFKIWKIALLRKSIILYSPYNSSTICIEGNEEIKHDNFKIGDMSQFLYCISLISSIPKEIEEKLINSVNHDIENLITIRPIYNVCVNDIYQLVKLDSNYLASTTDQIIIEKDNLYDYAIKLPLNSCNKNINIPEVKNSITDKLEYATPKDFEKFKIMYSKLNNTDKLLQIAPDVSENKSIQELIWSGLSWWASAGESFKSINEEFDIEFECFDDISNDNIDRLISVVGYFQKLTIKLFSVIIELIERFDVQNNAENTTSTIVLDANDISEMGLDPYSASDIKFVVDLFKLWWGRDVKIGSYFDNLCYWN